MSGQTRIEVGSLNLPGGQDWDDFVLRHGGSPFQSRGFCEIFEAAWPGRFRPLHITLFRGGALAAAVPAYLVRQCPRLDYYRNISAENVIEDPVLLSHALVGWHGFPLAGVPRDERLAVAQFAELAGREDAVAMFGGIPADRHGTIEVLKRQHFETAVFSTAMVRNLEDFSGEDSTIGLPRKKRARVRNDLNRARKAGTSIRPAQIRDHPAVLWLLAKVLEEKGAPRDILPERFVAEFLARSPRGLEVFLATDRDDNPIGVQVNFLWGDSYWIWLAGHTRESLNRHRQSHALYVHSINRAKALGCRVVEAGRDPYPIKRQHGFEPVRLLCAVRGSNPSQHRRASAWVKFLEERHFRRYRA